MNVELPNGTVIEDVPDDMPKLQIAQIAVKNGLATKEDFGGFVPEAWTPNKQPDAGINPISGNIEKLLLGGSFGLSENVQAAIGALRSLPPSQVTGEQPGYIDRYTAIRDDMRQKDAQFTNQEGVAAYVPEAIGGLVTGLRGLGMASTLKGGAAIGAVEGGIAGAGYADADNFISPETATGAGIGAGIGAVAGFALPLAGRFAKKGVNKVTDAIADRAPNLSGRTARIVAEEAATGSKPNIAARYNIQRKSTGGPSTASRDPLAGGPSAASRDTLAIRAIDDLEIPENIVASIKELSPADKKAGEKMLKIIRTGRGNTAFADKYRPGDVLGDTLKEKIDFISAERLKAGAQLDRLVKTRLKGQPVAVDDALQSFASKLDDLGVQINQSKTGKITPDFEGALKLNRNDRRPISDAIRKINRVIESGRPTADIVHDLKRALDNEIPWDSASKMTSEGEALLKSLRADLNTALQDTFDGYAQINGKLADTIDTMNNIAEAVGRKYDPTRPNADQYLGQELRKLATNYNSRIPLKNAIDQVEEISRKYGMESSADVSRQASMVNDLEDLFGPSARRGFRAEIGKGATDGLTEAAKRTVRGDKGAIIDKTLDAIRDTAKDISEDKQFDALEQLLKRQ